MKQKNKRLILGQGEGRDATGAIKKHVLDSKSNIEYDTTTDSITFMLNDMGILTHDEHDKMIFPKGKYRSYNQVEFNPFNNTIERVFD
jgi:hypothetical protein